MTGVERIVLKITENALIRPAIDLAEERAGLSPEELGKSSSSVGIDENGRAIVSDYTDDKCWTSVQIGTRRSFEFRLSSPLGSFFPSGFLVPVFNSSETFTLKTLPKELQDRFDDASKEAKDHAAEFLRRERDAQAKTSGP